MKISSSCYLKSVQKTFIYAGVALATFGALASSSVSARDLSYKLAVGYRQVTAVRIDDTTKVSTREQLNGIEASYGIAEDLQVGVNFGMEKNLDFVAVGPSLRYDLQRLINRDASAWQYLNMFVETKFLAKFGKESKAGVTFHAPYIGFEIMPFTNNNFALLTSAGLVLDFGNKNHINFTQGILGDVGVRYYF